MLPADNQSIEATLDICLDRILKDKATIDSVLAGYPLLADELRPQLEAALWLTIQKSNTDPSPEFVSASPQRLMKRIQLESQAQKQKKQQFPSFWQNLFTSKKFALQFGLAIIVIFSTVLFGSTAALAAQNAIPGEILYPLKTSLETIQLTITTSPVKEAQLHIQYADRRLTELQSLGALEDYDNFDNVINNMNEHVTQALQGLQSQSMVNPEQTKDLAEKMQRSLSWQEQTLASLKSKAPLKNQEALQSAVNFSSQAMGITQNVIISISPEMAATLTSTNTATSTSTETPLPSETPSVTTIILAQPSAAMMASETLEPTSTQNPTKTAKVTKTPKPANTHKPTAKPTKTPKPDKPTKTPKPDKPTKTPKD